MIFGELDEESQEDLDVDRDEESQEEGDLGSSRRRSASSQNMCCKCNDGTVSWSQSGSCSHCRSSGISTKSRPPAKCQEGSSSGKGSNSRRRVDPNWPQQCAKMCQSQLGGAATSSRRRGRPSGNYNPQRRRGNPSGYPSGYPSGDSRRRGNPSGYPSGSVSGNANTHSPQCSKT